MNDCVRANFGRISITNGYRGAVAAVLFLVLSTGQSGEPAHYDEHQQAPHLHGLVEMTLAIEGQTIEMNLESPAANLVGFEHPASTPEQRASVTRAKKILASPQQLLTFIGTGCEASRHEVDVSAVLAAEGDDHKEQAHDEHDEHGETHSEISAGYQFICGQASTLTAIKVHLFDLFPGIDRVNVAWVTESSQASATLTAGAATINLKGQQ